MVCVPFPISPEYKVPMWQMWTKVYKFQLEPHIWTWFVVDMHLLLANFLKKNASDAYIEFKRGYIDMNKRQLIIQLQIISFHLEASKGCVRDL